MTKDIGRAQRDLYDDEAEGWMDNLFADENRFDGQMMFKLGSWAVASVVAVVVGFLATQVPESLRRDPGSDLGLANQARQLQLTARDSQNEARRLAAAVDTLNSDRDRLYSRVTVLEQNLDSVTGSIAKSIQGKTSIEGVTTATDSAAAVSAIDSNAAASKKTDLPVLPHIAAVQSIAPGSAANAAPASTPGPLASNAASGSDMPDSSESKVQPAQFGIDIGGANSLEGLRAIWRGALKSSPSLLGPLQPVAMMKEGKDGLGMRLRLVAGPFEDAAATAKICATLINAKRPCATSAYDGQRLAMDLQPVAAARKPKPKATAAPPPGPFLGHR